jgi:nucleotide-binding universal stress UspA family protein
MAARVGPVLMGTDFSDGSAMALVEARRLAGLLGAELRVVHVAAAGVDGQADALPPRSVRWLAEQGLSGTQVVTRAGQAWVELARYAAETAPTLLVVGSHGESGYQPLEIGSTAARLSLHARCAVVVVSPRVGGEMQVQESNVNAASRADAVAEARAEPGDQQLVRETR